MVFMQEFRGKRMMGHVFCDVFAQRSTVVKLISNGTSDHPCQKKNALFWTTFFLIVQTNQGHCPRYIYALAKSGAPVALTKFIELEK